MTITPLDMLCLRLAREGKPKSKALPQRYYTGDPADNVEFEVEKARKTAIIRARKADKQLKPNKKFRGK
jgi:hypothetical protein